MSNGEATAASGCQDQLIVPRDINPISQGVSGPSIPLNEAQIFDRVGLHSRLHLRALRVLADLQSHVQQFIQDVVDGCEGNVASGIAAGIVARVPCSAQSTDCDSTATQNVLAATMRASIMTTPADEASAAANTPASEATCSVAQVRQALVPHDQLMQEWAQRAVLVAKTFQDFDTLRSGVEDLLCDLLSATVCGVTLEARAGQPSWLATAVRQQQEDSSEGGGGMVAVTDGSSVATDITGGGGHGDVMREAAATSAAAQRLEKSAKEAHAAAIRARQVCWDKAAEAATASADATQASTFLGKRLSQGSVEFRAATTNQPFQTCGSVSTQQK
jgi:hypothetical protein